jgi:4-amino-4-deoxy-L-arabinose transferase-like glycosyltransferase
MSKIRPNRETITLVFLFLLALALRLWALDKAPPGWRDDELSNTLVISQHVLDGNLRLFYPDASGHEFLYHALNAVFLHVFGPGLMGIRLLSALFGAGVVVLTYVLAREMFDRATGWIAALGVAASFWALMYSRVGQRHISAPFFALAAFIFLWRSLNPVNAPRKQRANAILAGLAIGLGFYTYFASRIPPLAVAALALYLALFDRDRLRQHWKNLGLTLVIAAALYLPLWHAARTTPGAEARVDELAVPIKSAQQGDFEPLRRQALVVLQMFHADGDDEWLYNVAHRPVFGPVGAILFFGGLALAIIQALPPRLRGQSDPRYALLLIWLAGSLAPGVLAVPAASLGHTLLALPVAYILPAILVGKWGNREIGKWAHSPIFLLALVLFLGTETYRGLNDYFNYWPERGYVRLLHNADYHDVAGYLNQQAAGDVAIGGALIEPWEQEALKIDLQDYWRARWFDPRRALVQPNNGDSLIITHFPAPDPALIPLLQTPRVQARTYTVYPAPHLPQESLLARFEDGLALHSVSDYQLDGDQLTFRTTWSVERPLDLPPNPLLPKPPPPGVQSGPRLAIFTHLLDASGAHIAGQDGLGVDPYTLQPGDRFTHLHQLSLPADQSPHAVALGLYDPRTEERWYTDQGTDNVTLFTLEEQP